MKHCCNDMELYLNSEDKTITYSPRFNEYGISVCDGKNNKSNSYIVITHCPWCGKKLPDSKREEWFEELEKLGFDNPIFDDSIPQKFKTSEWYEG